MDKVIERIYMTDNIIKFPSKKMETVTIEDEVTLGDDSIEFAYAIIDEVHDLIHESSGECIFTDDEYKPLVLCITESLAALYLMSHGVEHPFQELAQEIFGDDIDISSGVDYNDPIDDIDDKEL
jgi:hypothetical protein